VLERFITVRPDPSVVSYNAIHNRLYKHILAGIANIPLAAGGCWHGLEPLLCMDRLSIRLGFDLPGSRSLLLKSIFKAFTGINRKIIIQ